MIVLFLIAGFLASIIGALPLGASNIAVINTTIKHGKSNALKIIITAGVAEVILSYYALSYNMTVMDFFESNQWIQVLVALTLLLIGGMLFFKKTKTSKAKHKTQPSAKSNYIKGFFLGLLNPPVLVYWLIVFGILNTNELMLSLKSPWLEVVLFFIGVYFGKFLTLYLFSTFSLVVKRKFSNVNSVINRFTGSLLFFVGIVQVVKLYLL
ncbi:LysE family transporter [Winogradskyella maritima]|uniref:LysE family translocator n=1 Tax=Winogradskyella maritima TaxID=1517766 RepID=A0ABV8ADG7_9FLAO|nr:LysE family transporter [Winogradskyella maritima]